MESSDADQGRLNWLEIMQSKKYTPSDPPSHEYTSSINHSLLGLPAEGINFRLEYSPACLSKGHHS